MNHLVIGIPTYKRPAMLAKLVDSIYQCNIDGKLIQTIDILVVDNDSERSAAETAQILKKNCPLNFNFIYHNYAIKGLSHVRNEILAKAIQLNSDYIIFVDDDEFVTKDWLNELVGLADKNKADIVQGPNIPVFEDKIKDSIAVNFSYLDFDHNQAISDFESNNVLLKTQFIIENDLTFDERFNITGGEDSYFGVVATQKKAKNYWSKKAIVYETIPSNRANLKWLIKRTFRGASTYTYILKLKKDFMQMVKKFFISLAYLLTGIITLPLALIPFNKRYWGILAIADSLGALAGMFSLRYNEYS
ncbi:glycosyltransferase family 2 protein [Aurantibacter crassamenti]|uniref:glycosyltransferase family 2 protein n=1 Tax=Aurantibacter crassamenti TaxID=1837375 RepID=UPI00193ACDA3|nr:glycosyltransferase family 2 protein [Aurantibacter crassamenti]MBM1105814.1 glycosyltransferase family 2 protein [Aurantibacter crassamenti]